MNRLQVSSAYTGPANFICAVNPYEFDPQDSSQYSAVEVLHGAPSYQVSYFDNRVRTLTWPAYELSSNNITNLVTYFRSIKGEVRYFDFQDISSLNNSWPTTAVSTANSDWKYARIIDLDIKYKPGGKLRYESLNLILQPEVP